MKTILKQKLVYAIFKFDLPYSFPVFAYDYAETFRVPDYRNVWKEKIELKLKTEEKIIK